jgi:hypothetical protein
MAAPKRHSLLRIRPISTTGRRSTLASSPPLSVNDSEALAVQLLMRSLPALLVRRLLLVSLTDSASYPCVANYGVAAQTGQAAADAFNTALGVSGTSSTAPAVTTTSVAVVVASTTAAAATEACPAVSTVMVMMTTTVGTGATTTTAAVATATAASGTNVQNFAGALGGIGAPPVIETSGDRPFSTDGSTFVNAAAALQRSCSVQHNQCADAANAGTLAGGEEQCETQENACNAFNNV